MSYITSLIKAIGKLHKTFLFHTAWENVKAFQRDASASSSIPPLLSAPTFQLPGALEVALPCDCGNGAGSEARVCKAAGELSANRKWSFQRQRPWVPAPELSVPLVWAPLCV